MLFLVIAVVWSSEMNRVRMEQRKEQEMQQAELGQHLVRRALITAEDMRMEIPELVGLYTDLDALVAASSRGKDSSATMYRLGSIGAHRHQIDFYYRAATNPAVRVICEVGFNAGHSTAVWLAANPIATIHSFDLFRVYSTHLPLTPSPCREIPLIALTCDACAIGQLLITDAAASSAALPWPNHFPRGRLNACHPRHANLTAMRPRACRRAPLLRQRRAGFCQPALPFARRCTLSL